ncbi:MAG: hypothetical protein HRU35_04660 [Rickettsiaceae bacterium]|nr:hypothetical protein [Rickettsiaceae bacterium]
MLSNRLQQKLSNEVIDKILNLIEKSPVLDQVAFFNDKNINIFFNNNDETVIAQKLKYDELKLDHLQKSYLAISGYYQGNSKTFTEDVLILMQLFLNGETYSTSSHIKFYDDMLNNV